MASDKLPERIRAALERDPSVNLHHWPITVTAGESVHLTGTVESITAKRHAYRLARQVADTARIHDGLKVAVSRERPDAELRQAVLTRLMQEPVFRDTPLTEGAEAAPPENGIRIDARDGVVRLDGTLGSLTHRRLAEVLAWWTPGVGDVDNRLHVVPTEADSDDELTDAIRMVLEMEPSVDAGELTCQVRDRVVHLHGRVATDAVRQRAISDCWYVPGVHEVRDHLRVG